MDLLEARSLVSRQPWVNPMVSAVIDFFSRAIQFFYELSATIGVPSYGIAIALFTLAIKAILFPMTKKQYMSMAQMQLIQPELQKIQKKYKNNPEKQQQEMMALYQEYQVSPFASCLPLLIQMPILLALFTTLRGFFDPINHPAYVNLDKATFLGVSLGATPSSLGFSAVSLSFPILVGLGTFVQQRVTMAKGGATPQGDGAGAQTQKIMLYFMPIFIGYISWKFPVGLCLYWIVYSVYGIIEQFLIRREPKVVKEAAGKK